MGNLLMGWPQIAVLLWMIAVVYIHASRHGREIEFARFDGKLALLRMSIGLAVLYFGGFFTG